MKKLFFLLALMPGCWAQGTSLVILGLLVKCPTATPAIVAWTGTAFQCATLGTGLALVIGALTITSPAAPLWQIDTVGLTTLPAAATSTAFTPTKPPNNGTVLWWYQSQNLFMTSSGALQWTGSPITITLPPNWSSTDTIVFAYQYQ